MAAGGLGAQTPMARDSFPAQGGEVTVTFVGHGTLVLTWGSLVVHVDPVGEYADYAKMPKADLVLVTHDHADHLDPAAIAAVRKPGTEVVLSAKGAAKVKGTVMANGERRTLAGIAVEAVPAYNIRHERAPGNPFHPKGDGNGYVVTLGGLRIYVAGDTEDTPEMRKLERIDVAFLPMNLPYTMTPEMVADAARAFTPKVLYPYHYGDTNPKRLAALLADAKGIEVRIRSMINHTALRTVNFNRCKIEDVNFAMCDKLIFEIHFKECVLDFSKFYTLKIKGTTFIDCSIIAVNFMSTDLTEVIFDNRDLYRSEIGNANANKA